MENNENLETKKYVEVFAFSDEEIALSLYNFLVENAGCDIQYTFDEESNIYHLLCEGEYELEIKSQILFYFSENPPKNLLPSEAHALSDKLDKLVKSTIDTDTSSKAYVSAKDKYTDVKSSAGSFLFVGFLGLIILILDIVGVFNFPIAGASRVLFFVCMTAIFLIFIVLGLFSYKKAKVLSSEINNEEKLEDDIVSYITDELDLNPVENVFEEDTPSEVKCLTRTEYIVRMTLEKFPETKESFIEHIVEELYEDLYE